MHHAACPGSSQPGCSHCNTRRDAPIWRNVESCACRHEVMRASRAHPGPQAVEPTFAPVAVLALSLGAHAADDEGGGASAEDFAASKGATAEAQLRERLLKRVRTIPGTD